MAPLQRAVVYTNTQGLSRAESNPYPQAFSGPGHRASDARGLTHRQKTIELSRSDACAGASVFLMISGCIS